MKNIINGFLKVKINEEILERQFECSNLEIEIENNVIKFYNVNFIARDEGTSKVKGKYTKHKFSLNNVIEFKM